MDKDCAAHENIIVDRLSKTIEDKVELSLTTKMSKVTRWIVGSILLVIGMFVAILMSNSRSRGRMEAQSEVFMQYMIEQNLTNKELAKLNVTLKDQLVETQTNQMVVMSNMKRIDPDFIMPFQLRGESVD